MEVLTVEPVKANSLTPTDGSTARRQCPGAVPEGNFRRSLRIVPLARILVPEANIIIKRTDC